VSVSLRSAKRNKRVTITLGGPAIPKTPRYDERSFGTNEIEAALTAYACGEHLLTPPELNAWGDDLESRSYIERLDKQRRDQ